MKMRYLLNLIAVMLLVFLSSSFMVKKTPASTYNLIVIVTNIRNTTGTMQLQLYRTQESFEGEYPYKTFRMSKKDVTGNTMSYTMSNLDADTYGVALLDDENNNKKMDYGIALPKEGFGFSDYYHTAWSKPTFYKFNFFLNKHRTVYMKIRYM